VTAFADGEPRGGREPRFETPFRTRSIFDVELRLAIVGLQLGWLWLGVRRG